MIAEGSPPTVRNDPQVVASYLGTDERAIARSGVARRARRPKRRRRHHHHRYQEPEGDISCASS